MKKEYILKHKNIPVMTFFMDDKTYKIIDLGDILSAERLPYVIADKNNKIENALSLNIWIQGRGLSESRKDKISIKEQFKVNELKALTIQAQGLNLTDHYWLHEADKNIEWEKVNHFDNIFDEVKPGANIIPGIDESVSLNSPNLCVDGSIEKRWIARDGQRYLLKGSRYERMQEPFNERIASMIMDAFKINHVNYDLRRTNENIPYSECKCMCNRDIEYLNAQWAMNFEDRGSKDLYTHFLDTCRDNNIKDAKERIDEMMAVDFLIGNEDRHRGNFGILRNADTLEWTGISPVFDNGNSLFFDCENEKIQSAGIDSLGKAFGDSNRLNLQLIDYPQWYNKNDGKKIADIVADVLNYNEKLSPQRIDKVVEITKERIEIFEKTVIQKERPHTVQGADIPNNKDAGFSKKELEAAKRAGYIQGVCECVAAIGDDHTLGKKLLTEMNVTKDMAKKIASPETYKTLEQGIFAQKPGQKLEQAQGVKR